jgi:cytochrome P450
MPDGVTAVPTHVRPDHVYDFDFLGAPELLSEPHRRIRRLHAEAPEIFWTPRNGGHWVVTRVAPALEMLRRQVDFAADPKFNQAKERWPRTIPNQVDDPDHSQFRRILNPWFSPAAITRREAEVRALATDLIDRVLPEGGCDFIHEISQHFSVTIFMRMVAAPPSDRARLVDMAERYTRSADNAGSMSGLADLGRYLSELIEERRRQPGDDLMSHVIASELHGRPLTEDELLGTITLVFLAGLDTVSAMLSFIMVFLARHPDHYRRLVEDRAAIPGAVEELMRAHGVSGMERGATHDFEFRDVAFQRGDRIVFMPQLLGLDDQQIEDPDRVDFDREISAHLVFGAGPHRCIGSHLARLELRVFLEEWTARIAAFRLGHDGVVPTSGGIVWIPQSVPLLWDAPAALAGQAA